MKEQFETCLENDRVGTLGFASGAVAALILQCSVVQCSHLYHDDDIDDVDDIDDIDDLYNTIHEQYNLSNVRYCTYTVLQIIPDLL